jgi:hypothetical protein
MYWSLVGVTASRGAFDARTCSGKARLTAENGSRIGCKNYRKNFGIGRGFFGDWITVYTLGSYFLLVDYTGRLFRDRKAAISAELSELFKRLGSNAERWWSRIE